MKNSNNNNQEFDKTFNERFSDFHFNPDPAFFDRIQSKMENQQFDQEVKNRFDQYTATPSDKVWESVQPNLPLHLGIRIQLQRLSRIAAVLLFTMTGLYFYQTQQDASEIASTEILPSEGNTALSADESDFVFEVPESVPVEEVNKEKAQKKLRKKKKAKKKGTADYLALILGEEDDFDEFIDHKKIKEILQPVEQLSPEFMSASALAPLPRYASYPVTNNQDIELNINIPLQVVEPHEVDDLIRLYDQTQRAERD